MTPPTLCHCGKESFVVKCSSLSSPLGSISCGRVCNKKLNCGVHYCQADCHPGQCSPCQSKVSMTCSCGNSTTELICGDPKTKEPFRCQRVCGLTFSCKAHTCEEVCHSHPPDPVPCPTDPLIVTHCPCGKTPVESLTVKRTSCQDRIVTCTKTCGKLLPCGHACLSVCHVGSCSPCRQPLEMDCRCGKQRIRSLCHAINKDDFGSPLCSNPCQQKMHCKRHRCGDLCCVKEIHICEKTCSKPLSCGLHTCLQPCGHPQRCHDCVEGVSFEERVCACGRTKMMPPIPCNTPPIICSYPCRRVRPCGHRQLTEHKCHSDSVSCPPCMAFARREW